MDRMPLGLDELLEHWTVLEDERKLIGVPVVPTKDPTDMCLNCGDAGGSAGEPERGNGLRRVLPAARRTADQTRRAGGGGGVCQIIETSPELAQ
jgi:hypothetical protein